MRMNVNPIPTVSERVNEIRALTADIVNKEILPNENMLWAWRSDPRVTPGELEEAKVRVVADDAGIVDITPAHVLVYDEGGTTRRHAYRVWGSRAQQWTVQRNLAGGLGKRLLARCLHAG